MTDRQRLIEILGCNKFQEWNAEQLADYLISKGVFVLPCAIGDTVYYVNGCARKLITKHKVRSIHIEKNCVRLEIEGLYLCLDGKHVFTNYSDALKRLEKE